MPVTIVNSDSVPGNALASLQANEPEVETCISAADLMRVIRDIKREGHDVVLIVLEQHDVLEHRSLQFTDRRKRTAGSVLSLVSPAAYEESEIAVERRSNAYGAKLFSLGSIFKTLNQNAGKPRQEPATSPQLAPGANGRPQSHRMAIKANGKILFIDPAEVISVRAEGNYVSLQKSSGTHFLRATISEMMSKLERYGFIRVHRSLLVNTLFVEEIQAYPTGDYKLRVKSGKQYTVSRTYKKNLKALADFWIGTDAFSE